MKATGTIDRVVVVTGRLVGFSRWGLPRFGDTISFEVTSSQPRPFLALNCYRDGMLVYSMSVGCFADYPFRKTFLLSSSYWLGGAAQAKATLYYVTSQGRERVLDTMLFEVLACSSFRCLRTSHDPQPHDHLCPEPRACRGAVHHLGDGVEAEETGRGRDCPDRSRCVRVE